MALAAALCGNLPYTFGPRSSCHSCHLMFNQKQRFLLILGAPKKKSDRPLMIRSVLKNLKSHISNGDNGAPEQARVLLERLFAKAQKLEEIMSRDSNLSEDAELGLNFEVLESDLQAALSALRKKEEDLQDAERRVLQGQAKLNQTKQELKQQEQEIAAAFAKQEQMEEELKKANSDFASQARQIEDLRLLVAEQGRKIGSLQSSLSQKEEELDKLKTELIKKNEEAAVLHSELESKEQLLYEANKAIKEQEARIEELQIEVKKKEDDLAKSEQLIKAEEERLKAVEANHEKRSLVWLSARKEVEKLAQEATKHMDDMKGTAEEFQRVRTLLNDVRSGLIYSEEFLASSRKKMEEETCQFEARMAELNERKLLLISDTKSLKDVQSKVENGRTKLGAGQARHKELEEQLSVERELIKQLQEDLTRERASLEQKTREISLLQNELQQKEQEYNDAQSLLSVKESELVEARLQIQHMRSEVASVKLVLQEKDADLLNAQEKLAEVNHDIAELQSLMNKKEHQLALATARLWEKEEYIQIMQQELDDTRLKCSEATSVVQRIAHLTNELVVSAKDEDGSIPDLLDEGNQMHDMEQYADFRKQKQLETELQMVKESLRQKEIDSLAAQRSLAVKEEEIRAVLRRWDIREKEMEKMKEDLLANADGPRKLCSLAQERIGDRSVEDLASENRQIEAAPLEAQAAIAALQKLADMTSQLLKGTNSCMNSDTCVLPPPMEEKMAGGSSISLDRRIDGLEEAEKEVARLFTLTERLVKEVACSVTKLQQ